MWGKSLPTIVSIISAASAIGVNREIYIVRLQLSVMAV
jgi:hypothetical protein